MATLYGINTKGKVFTKQTKIAYQAGLVRDGSLAKCFRTVSEASAQARPGDVVIGLTRAVLKPGIRLYIVYLRNTPHCYPACYERGCDNPGGNLGLHWTGYGNEIVPACWKHARRETA
jgi:hypothetical protein